MDKIAIGSRVQVTYEGVLTGDGDFSYNVKDSYGTYHWYSKEVNLKIEVVDPQYWPPQVGDIWSVQYGDTTVEYSVRGNFAETGYHVLSCLDSDKITGSEDLRSDYYEKSFKVFRDLGPVLVRRRGVKKG